MNDMARANMGAVPAFFDQAAFWQNMPRKSASDFRATFKARLKQEFELLYAQRHDLVAALVEVGDLILQEVLGQVIPLPVVATIVVEAVGGLVLNPIKQGLHERAFKAADKTLGTHTGTQLSEISTSDTDAVDEIKRANEDYKKICAFTKTLPKSITTFEDAVTFPEAVFNVEKATSHLSIALERIQNHLSAMQERCDKCKGISEKLTREVHTAMPQAAKNCIYKAYNDGVKQAQKDNVLDTPVKPASVKPILGLTIVAAANLAAYLAHASAMGYYDGIVARQGVQTISAFPKPTMPNVKSPMDVARRQPIGNPLFDPTKNRRGW